MSRVEQYAKAVRASLEAAVVEFRTVGGPNDGATERAVPEALIATILEAIPVGDVEHQTAEVRTPAIVVVDALCPICGLRQEVTVGIADAGIDVRPDGSRLIHVATKAGKPEHQCNQLRIVTTPSAGDDSGQVSFDLADIVVDREPCPYPGCVLDAEHDGDHHVDHDDRYLDPGTDAEPEAAPEPPQEPQETGKRRRRRRSTSTPDTDADGTGEGTPLPEPGEEADDDDD